MVVSNEQLIEAREVLDEKIGDHVRVGWWHDSDAGHAFALDAYDSLGTDVLAIFDFGFEESEWSGETLIVPEPIEIAERYRGNSE